MDFEEDERIKFFPGLIRKSEIKEEEALFNDKYSLRLGPISSTKESSLCQMLEKHYDWTRLKEVILEQLEITGDNFCNFEENVYEEVNNWLGTFDGWGLSFLLVDTDADDHEGLQSFILHLYDHILEDANDEKDPDPEDAFKSLFTHWFPALEEEMDYVCVDDCKLLKGPKGSNKWTSRGELY